MPTTDTTVPENMPKVCNGTDGIWKAAREEEPDQGVMTLLGPIPSRTRTVRVNTGHQDCVRMIERKEALEQPG